MTCKEVCFDENKKKQYTFLGETRKEVEDLLNHVNSEKLLTDSTYRFNAFIIGLLK